MVMVSYVSIWDHTNDQETRALEVPRGIGRGIDVRWGGTSAVEYTKCEQFQNGRFLSWMCMMMTALEEPVAKRM